MKIKRFNDPVNERRTELFGTDRKPSNVISRQNQDFYDYYTRRKFRGKSKYDLNTEVFKLAQDKDDPIGILAQFCLQIERESIAADDYIAKMVDQLSKELHIELDMVDDLRDSHKDKEQGIEVDDVDVEEVEELQESDVFMQTPHSLKPLAIPKRSIKNNLKDFTLREIEDYLETKGYSIIKTKELDYLEDRNSNHPG